MAKAKKPRSAKQLANDERLRNARKKPEETPTTPPAAGVSAPPVAPEEDEFEPTAVKEAKAAAEQQPEVAAPPIPENAEQVPVEDEKPTGPELPAQPQVDMNLVATIVAAMQAVNAQNPQIAKATPEEKLDATIGMQANAHPARVGLNGVQGITYRYNVEKSHYPDPSARLLAEPRLARFAMQENFRFKWSVDGETYEKHGMTFAEPRFTLELYRLLFDEDGQPTGRMALIARSMMHEDDFVVRTAAANLGLLEQFGDDEESFIKLRDEIRYWRTQQWLFGIFTPAKINTFKRAPREENIDGKIVMVYDTEDLIDHDTGVAKSSTLKTQEGVGNIKTS